MNSVDASTLSPCIEAFAEYLHIWTAIGDAREFLSYTQPKISRPQPLLHLFFSCCRTEHCKQEIEFWAAAPGAKRIQSYGQCNSVAVDGRCLWDKHGTTLNPSMDKPTWLKAKRGVWWGWGEAKGDVHGGTISRLWWFCCCYYCCWCNTRKAFSYRRRLSRQKRGQNLLRVYNFTIRMIFIVIYFARFSSFASRKPSPHPETLRLPHTSATALCCSITTEQQIQGICTCSHSTKVFCSSCSRNRERKPKPKKTRAKATSPPRTRSWSALDTISPSSTFLDVCILLGWSVQWLGQWRNGRKQSCSAESVLFMFGQRKRLDPVTLTQPRHDGRVSFSFNQGTVGEEQFNATTRVNLLGYSRF